MGIAPGPTSTRIIASIWLSLIASWHQSIPPNSSAAGGSGRFVPECNGVTFYLTKVEELKVYADLAPWWVLQSEKKWKDVSGERRSPGGKSERATNPRIWLGEGGKNSSHISGKYQVDFGGQHLEGQFVAKYRKHSPPVDCM